MEIKNAARRLLKSRLRHHVATTLAAERAHQNWPYFLEMEEGISEEAWKDWQKIRAHHASSESQAQGYEVEKDLPKIVVTALDEATESVRATFDGLVEKEWLDRQIRSFLDSFQVEQLF